MVRPRRASSARPRGASPPAGRRVLRDPDALLQGAQAHPREEARALRHDCEDDRRARRGPRGRRDSSRRAPDPSQVEEVKEEQILRKQREREELPGKKDAYDFDVKHAKELEGRTWVEDLPDEDKFGGDEYAENSRMDRAKEFDEYAAALAEAEKLQADAEGADED